MKWASFVLLPTIPAILLLAACDRQPRAAEAAPPAASPPANPAPTPSPATLDGAKLRQALASAGSEEQSRAGKAAQAIEAGAYSVALIALEKLLVEGHLTQEQKNLMTSYVALLKEKTQKKP
jgi:hypothetical protein